MIDGFYTVNFESNFGLSGSGVAVISKGKIYGGDSMMVYVGSYNLADWKMNAEMEVKKVAATSCMQSVVGLDNFHLSVHGDVSNLRSFTMTGVVKEDSTRTISISAVRYAELS